MEVTRRDDDTFLKNGSIFQMMKISQTTELLARFLKSQPRKCTLKIFKKLTSSLIQINLWHHHH